MLQCQRAAAAAGAGEGAPREPVAHLGAARGGQREAGYECAGGGAEPASLASEGSRGGRAPGGPPDPRRMPHEELPSLQRPRYGCKCAGRSGRRHPWLAPTPRPRNALEKPREPGARLRGDGRAAAVWLQSCELELQRVVSGVPTNS